MFFSLMLLHYISICCTYASSSNWQCYSTVNHASTRTVCIIQHENRWVDGVFNFGIAVLYLAQFGALVVVSGVWQLTYREHDSDAVLKVPRYKPLTEIVEAAILTY